MRRAFALLVLALAAASAAVAGKGDPQKRLTPADQARAKAMLVRKSDVGATFRAGPPLVGASDTSCTALDESDLVLTGEAQSPTFQGGVETVSSRSRVFRSLRDSNASWRRGTSRAGERCVRAELAGVLTSAGGMLESFGRIDFPGLAERTSAYRLVVTSQGLRAYLDVVGLKQGRAQVALLFGSALTPVPREVEVRVARAVARRMQAAMRGA
jgi:hypothetical protein